MEGIVKSYVPEKRFGFIDGADGRSYFFHVNAFIDQPNKVGVLDGALVSFDPTATPKGLAAKRLTLVRNQAVAWETPPEFLVIREDAPRRGEIVTQVDAVAVSGGQSLDDLRVQIRQLAEAMGANALVGLHYSKSTARLWHWRLKTATASTVRTLSGWWKSDGARQESAEKRLSPAYLA